MDRASQAVGRALLLEQQIGFITSANTKWSWMPPCPNVAFRSLKTNLGGEGRRLWSQEGEMAEWMPHSAFCPSALVCHHQKARHWSATIIDTVIFFPASLSPLSCIFNLSFTCSFSVGKYRTPPWGTHFNGGISVMLTVIYCSYPVQDTLGEPIAFIEYLLFARHYIKALHELFHFILKNSAHFTDEELKLLKSNMLSVDL